MYPSHAAHVSVRAALFAGFERQWDWRRLHEYFLFERPEGCVRALRLGLADTCGSELSELIHSPYYSGNFFWTTCRHVRRLPHPMDYCFADVCRQRDDVQYPGPEMWLLSRAATARNCFDSGIDFHAHYSSRFPRERYSGRACTGADHCFFGSNVYVEEAYFGVPGRERDVKREFFPHLCQGLPATMLCIVLALRARHHPVQAAPARQVATVAP